MNDNTPVEVWPLATFLAEEMEERGWKTEDIAARMNTGAGFGRDLLMFNLCMCVHRENLLIDDRTFSGIARAFDACEDYLRNLDAIWRKYPAARVAWECPDKFFGAESRRAFILPVP